MSVTAAGPMPALTPEGAIVERHWQQLASRRRFYTIGGLALLLLALSGSLWFANETNAGKFFDRLPYVFDFFIDLRPRDWFDPVRALFDLPSPYEDGSLKFDYPDGRVYVAGSLYIPEYFYKMLETLNIALFSTLIGFSFGFLLCFFAAANMTTSRWLRFTTKRFLEIVRAFPEIVIAGFFLAIFSLGPIPAILAVSIHTVGALGKMFYEVVENADMKPDEGLRAVGANWVERVWFGIVPQVLPNFMSYFLLQVRDQRAGVDHHRRGRRRRHRRGAAPVDQPRPRGQDHRHRLPAVFDHRRRRPVLGMAAAAPGRQAGLRIPRSLRRWTPQQSTPSPRAIPRPSGSRSGNAIRRRSASSPAFSTASIASGSSPSAPCWKRPTGISPASIWPTGCRTRSVPTSSSRTAT